MSCHMECDLLGDSSRTDPFLHRLLRPAPLQAFEYKTFFLGTVPDQFQSFIAYRDDVFRLCLLGDGMDTFSSSCKVNDFLPAKGKYIAEPQTGQARKEGSSLRTGILHGVSARQYSSSTLRYSLATSSGSIFSRKSLTLVFIILLRYRIFRNPRKVDQ